MARSLLKVALALLTTITSGCLLLQDPPVNGVGGECEDDDWCESGLVCLRRNGASNPGVCSTKGSCYQDKECAAGSLCQSATSYSSGTCTKNTGCTADAQCAAGKSCFRGVCWQKCTSTLDCGTSAICSRVPCPDNMSLDSCPQACQGF